MANNEELILNVETTNPYVIGAVAKVEQLPNGALITIVDKNGTTTATVLNGVDGTGIASATLNDDYTLTLLFTDGTSTTTASIRGETGASGVYVGEEEPTDPDVDVWVDTNGEQDEDFIEAYVDKWLEEHPEATTTVEDWSLTNQKLVKNTLGFVVPQMFGAVGDGIADDSNAFLLCFDGTYKNILIPQGTYIVSQKISIPDNTNVVCDGVIKKSGTFDVLFDIGNNCDIQLNIDVNKATENNFSSGTSADIYINGKDGVRIHDSRVLNTNSCQALWVEKSSNITIENCTIDTYVYMGIGIRDGNSNIKVFSNTVLNGHGTNTNRYPICLNTSENLTVSKGIICDGNYIEDETPLWEGIDAHDLLDSVISNNVIINTATGIAVVNRGQASGNLAIKGNIYKNTAQTPTDSYSFGVVCTVVGGSSNVVISNNALYGCANSTASDKGGIKIYGIEDAVISDNTIACVGGVGIDCYSLSGFELKDFKIHHNIVDGATTGIKLANGSGINISGDIIENVIKNCTVGISGNENYGTGYDYCVYAKDNKFINCTTDFTNNTHGTIVSPSYSQSSGYGVKGMVLENLTPENGRIESRCVKSGTANDVAVWEKLYHHFSLSGEYTSSNGYISIPDDRITNTANCVISNLYTDGTTNTVFAVGQCLYHSLVVYLRNPDGSKYNGNIKLGILVIL